MSKAWHFQTMFLDVSISGRDKTGQIGANSHVQRHFPPVQKRSSGSKNDDNQSSAEMRAGVYFMLR